MGFIAIFPYMPTMYSNQINSLNPSPQLPSPLLKTFSACFIALFSYMGIKYYDHIHPTLCPLSHLTLEFLPLT
jgi:hypothetical protein